ncbi:MAG: hypothetical protein N3A61_09230, partial [Ignavibacteria bacterium]|nr:hypothetical protein [Ignavibacteria bacterium]
VNMKNLLTVIIILFSGANFLFAQSEIGKLSFKLDGTQYNLKIRAVSLSKTDKLMLNLSAEGETDVRKFSVSLSFQLEDELKQDDVKEFSLNHNEILKSSSHHETITMRLNEDGGEIQKRDDDKAQTYKLKGKSEFKVINVFVGKGVTVSGKFNCNYSTANKDFEVKIINGEFNFKL